MLKLLCSCDAETNKPTRVFRGRREERQPAGGGKTKGKVKESKRGKTQEGRGERGSTSSPSPHPRVSGSLVGPPPLAWRRRRSGLSGVQLGALQGGRCSILEMTYCTEGGRGRKQSLQITLEIRANKHVTSGRFHSEDHTFSLNRQTEESSPSFT